MRGSPPGGLLRGAFPEDRRGSATERTEHPRSRRGNAPAVAVDMFFYFPRPPAFSCLLEASGPYCRPPPLGARPPPPAPKRG